MFCKVTLPEGGPTEGGPTHSPADDLQGGLRLEKRQERRQKARKDRRGGRGLDPLPLDPPHPLTKRTFYFRNLPKILLFVRFFGMGSNFFGWGPTSQKYPTFRFSWWTPSEKKLDPIPKTLTFRNQKVRFSEAL